MTTQPAFWLQITNQYVIENFESLVQYVRLYHYDPVKEPENSDFMRTYRHLKAVADDYAAIVREVPFYGTPEFDIPVEKVMRIMGAAILTAEKIGNTDYDLLASLVNLIILSNPDLNADIETGYFKIINHCISRTPLASVGFSWYTVEAGSFMTGALEVKLAASTFKEDPENKTPHIYENRGMLLKEGDKLLLTNINYTDYRSRGRNLRQEFTTDLGIDVRTTSGSGRCTVTSLLELYPVIGGEFDNVKPSPTPKLKTYSERDSRIVRVVKVQGIKVGAVTVDPDYEQMHGNVFIDKEIFSIPGSALVSLLRPGDYLPVKGGGETGLTFRLDREWISEVLADYAEGVRSDGEDLECLFMRTFGNEGAKGTRWMSSMGVLVNLFDMYLNDAHREMIVRSAEENIPALLRVHDYKLDNGKCLINGRFGGLSESDPVDPADFARDAHFNFVNALLETAKAEAPDSSLHPAVGHISAYMVRLLGILTYRLGYKLNRDVTLARLQYMATAMLMFRMSGNDADADYVRAQLDYQKAIIGFAHGKSPFELVVPDNSSFPEAKKLNDNAEVVATLRNYHEATDATVAGKAVSDRTSTGVVPSTGEFVAKLVEASNALVGRIDESELNRIKKNICTHLGVSDEYRDICTSGTNYGVESEFLEFKASCVEPPAQWRTTSLDRNIELQKWNILKAVNAFLNSSSGGDLLIGVSDSGFALGLNDDIRTLYTTKRIAEPNIDRLRMYVKLFIDSAFTTVDKRVSGTAITAERVDIRIETSDQNRDILRVKVTPYPWDVVTISLPDRPSRFARAYIRTSGASSPLDTSGIRETKLRKMKDLDRFDYKTAKIMQAIDDKMVLEINDYAGHNGLARRRVEPFKLLSGLNAFLGFDLDRHDMRMFKLSRFKDTDIRITNERWRNEQHHIDREVDIFGMVENTAFPGTGVTLYLTDYARSLLIDECALETAGNASYVLRQNTDPIHSRRYPWVLEVTVYSYVGISRFVMGLPNHVKTMNSQGLDDYIARKRAEA